MIRRIVAVTVLAVAALASTSLTAAATAGVPVPEVCVWYNDPIHMGSYPVCPLD